LSRKSISLSERALELLSQWKLILSYNYQDDSFNSNQDVVEYMLKLLAQTHYEDIENWIKYISGRELSKGSNWGDD